MQETMCSNSLARHWWILSWNNIYWWKIAQELEKEQLKKGT